MIVALILLSAVFALGAVVVSVLNARRAPMPGRAPAGAASAFYQGWDGGGDGGGGE